MNCRIRVKGHLNRSWQAWFEGLQIIHEEAGTTLLTGDLQNQLVRMQQVTHAMEWKSSRRSAMLLMKERMG